MSKIWIACFVFFMSFNHISTFAAEPSIILKEGDRIEFNRYGNGKRTRATVTSVTGEGMMANVLQDDGERFTFTLSKNYADSYQVELLSGQASQANPEHKTIASRPPTLCPETSPKQGQTPDKALLKKLIICSFEDTSSGIYAGKTINVDILEYKVGKVYTTGNTLAYHSPNAPITPVRVKVNQRIYNTWDVDVTKGAVYDFDVYVDYHDRWAVNPRTIKKGNRITVPMPK